MKQDNIALGRLGEIYFLKKAFENGWSLPKDIFNINLSGLDWILEKNGLIIKVQVKTSLKENISFGINKYSFDYLIITNLKDIWVLPIELIGNISRMTKEFKKCNSMEILGKKGYELFGFLNDLGIKAGDYERVNLLFNK